MHGESSGHDGRARNRDGAFGWRAVHPVIKVSCFLVVALFLTRAQLNGVAITLTGLLGMRAAGVRFDPARIGKMLRRMRWLLLSILIVYLWFTPGTPLIPPLGHYSPTMEGVQPGLLRVITLMLIAVLVVLLLQGTSRGELIGAIRWLAAPLRLLGVDNTRIALRMTLILDSVEEIQPLLQRQMEGFSRRGNRLSRIADALAALFQSVISRAENTPPQRISVATLGGPPLYQWLYPMALVLLFAIGSR